MRNITIICTHHSNLGKCNSEALYAILESVKPEVIFEELPKSLFEKIYNGNQIDKEIPEVHCVKQYLKKYIAENFPVDIELNSTISDGDLNYMFGFLKRYTAYKDLENEQIRQMAENGYLFLNSTLNEEIIDKQLEVAKNILEFYTNQKRLRDIFETFYAEQYKRELEIVKNVYAASEKIDFNNAILFIGSGHRKSLAEKVKLYNNQSEFKINWSLYGD